MKGKNIITVLVTIFLISGIGNSPVLAQNTEPVHGIGEVYQYALQSYELDNKDIVINAYDGNNTNIYYLSDFLTSNSSSSGVGMFTFIGSEYKSLIDRAYSIDNSSSTLDQVPNDEWDYAYVLEETTEQTQESYSYNRFEWSQNYGVTKNNSGSNSGKPHEYSDSLIYEIPFNQTYSILLDDMLQFPGVHIFYNYIYELDIDQIIQYTLTLEVSNVMLEFTINGQTAMHSINLINVTSFASVMGSYSATVYLGDRWQFDIPYGTFPVNVNTTYYESSLLYFDAVDTRLLEYTHSMVLTSDFSINSTQQMYFPATATTSDVTLSFYGSKSSSFETGRTMTEFYPAPVSEGTNRLMKGDKLEFGNYLNENYSSYFESNSLDSNNSEQYWSKSDIAVVGEGNSTLEVVYHNPGRFGAIFYQSMNMSGKETFMDIYGGGSSYGWDETVYFFDFFPDMKSSDTQDIIFQPAQFYDTNRLLYLDQILFFAPIPYDVPVPFVNTSVEYDQLDAFINGYERTLDVELDISMYYVEFSGNASSNRFSDRSPKPLNLTISAYVINIFDVNTGAFIGRSELLYADLAAIDDSNVLHTRHTDITIEYENSITLQSHPYLYQEPPTSTAENTTDTSVNTTSTTQTTSSSTSSEPSNTSNDSAPTNPLPGFEFSVVAFSITGIYIITRRRN